MSDVKVKTVDNIRELIRKARQASFKNLGHAGGGLRKAAQRLIKRSKDSSLVGTPPHTARGALKNSILYAVEGDHTVVIGPSVNLISDVAAAHEHGREQRPRSLRGKTRNELLVTGTNWKLEVGGHGPIPDSKGTVYIKFKTDAQVVKSMVYIDNAPDSAFGNTKKARAAAQKRRILARSSGGSVKYPKRPFMGPALMQNLDRIPSIWTGSVR